MSSSIRCGLVASLLRALVIVTIDWAMPCPLDPG